MNNSPIPKFQIGQRVYMGLQDHSSILIDDLIDVVTIESIIINDTGVKYVITYHYNNDKKEVGEDEVFATPEEVGSLIVERIQEEVNDAIKNAKDTYKTIYDN